CVLTAPSGTCLMPKVTEPRFGRGALVMEKHRHCHRPSICTPRPMNWPGRKLSWVPREGVIFRVVSSPCLETASTRPRSSRPASGLKSPAMSVGSRGVVSVFRARWTAPRIALEARGVEDWEGLSPRGAEAAMSATLLRGLEGGHSLVWKTNMATLPGLPEPLWRGVSKLTLHGASGVF